MSFIASPLDWSRGSSRRSAGGGGALDWSRGSSKQSGGSASGKDSAGGEIINLDRSSSKANRSNPQVKSYVRRMSSLVADPFELDLDQRRLQNAVREAGEYSFGVDAIAVWMLDEGSGRLIHPDGGWWRSHEMDHGSGSTTARDVALARLEDSARDDYVLPKPVSPGTDIAGILWAESRGGNINASSASGLRRRSSMQNIFDSGLSLKSLDRQQHDMPNAVHTLNSQPIRWRDIQSINQDPDSAKGPRLKLIEEAGFAMAAGITFQYMHHQGMVIFLTCVEDKSDDRLHGVANGAYLHQAAQFIGAQLSLAELRRAALAEQYKLKDKCYSMHEHNSKSSIQPSQGLIEEGRSLNDGLGHSHGNNEVTNQHSPNCCHIPPQVMAWSHKLKGGSMQIPPTSSWTQTYWTVFGSFVGLLLLSALNEYYKLLSDQEYHLLIGPFGAMSTLMYGLSAAPASQPRNAIMGQAIAGAVSLAFTYIPEKILPVWLRTAVGPAFAIGSMVKLGVVHPPAGAHSVLYASGKYDFGFYALVVLSTAISVIPATIVNNMSSKRQYPTYWGLAQFSEAFLYGHGKQKSNFEPNLGKTESDGPSDGSKMSSKQVQTNRLEIHEEGDEGSSHSSTLVILDVQKELDDETENDNVKNKI